MKVAVVGAGLAGSAAAYRLRQRGHDVILIDRKARVGGRAWTDHREGFSIDVGADVILSFYERTLRLLDELGRRRHLVPLDNSGAMHDGRRVHTMRPASPLGILTHPALKLRDMARLGLAAGRAQLEPRIDPFDLEALAAADDGETVAQWARRTVGERAYQHVIRPGIETRWYYSCEEAAAPPARALTQLAPRTRFYCLEPGMGALAEWLTAAAPPLLGTEAVAVAAVDGGVAVRTADGGSLRVDAAILATDASRAAGLLGEGAARDALAGVRFARNVRVVLGYNRNPWPRPRVKAAFSSGPGEHLIAGVTLVSGKSPRRVPEGGEAAEVHFSGWASERLDDDEAVLEARRAVDDYLGSPAAEPSFTVCYRCDPGLPIPVPGQYGRLLDARDRLPERIRLAGDYLSLATIEGAVRSGETAAAEVDALPG